MVPNLARRPAQSRADSALARWRARLVLPLRTSLPRFLLVGSFGFAVDAVAFGAVSSVGAPDYLARALSLAAATLVTWRLNRRFTFSASRRAPHAEALRYAAVACCVQGFNYGLFLALRALLPSAHPLAALVLSTGAAAGLSFAGQGTLTFGARLWPRPLPVGSRT